MPTPNINAKKSPRAPSMSLKDALERVMRAYDRERLHEAPTEVVAQNIGYKNANSGTALSAIASLRYFGLLIRPRNGFLAVSKEVETFKFAPTEVQRQALLATFLTKPPLYQDLLKKYVSGLPSDANLKYELIERGFIPAAAETALVAFRESVEFTRYFQNSNEIGTSIEDDEELSSQNESQANISSNIAAVLPTPSGTVVSTPSASPALPLHETTDEHDRIPVRLSGGRRAWLIIPTPFYQADKQRLKAQIDLLLAEDEDAIN
jgi:hypothetical protein